MKHLEFSFAQRCEFSSPAWGDLRRTELRAVSMLSLGRVLTYDAWRGLSARLKSHADQLRSVSTIPSQHGRVWKDGVAIRLYRRLRSMQQQADALAQVAALLEDDRRCN